MTKGLDQSIKKFVHWLENYGEYSQDQYDYWAGKTGRWAKQNYYKHPKLGAIPVLPLVFLDSFLPATRKYFRRPTRFPIADAHYAMGFAYLFEATNEEHYYQKAVHFLNKLIETRCPGYSNYAWGYPFQWMTNSGMFKKQTPLITSTPYVYEAFLSVYNIDKSERWLTIMRSIAEHVAEDYFDNPYGEKSSSCSYIATSKPASENDSFVINANSYRAFMLTSAANQFEEKKYQDIANRNLNFVLDAQQKDGSWFYAVGNKDQFVDHFHTCFVLKNLIKIEQITGNNDCKNAIRKGVQFYLENLLDEEGIPKPFAKKQRITTYRRELYDYAESLNLALLVNYSKSDFGKIPDTPLDDVLKRWQKPDGAFRTRQLMIGWNNTPYHRWAQSQLFRSLSLRLLIEQENL